MQEHLEDLALPPAARILDIGCGTGNLAMWFWSRGFPVWGVDSSPAMIARAGRKLGGGGPVFHVANALDGLPFADGSFDLVYCSHVMHGLESSRRTAFLEEARRVSRGKVLVLDYPPFPGLSGLDAPLTRFVEILEGSQFRSFIIRGAKEMRKAFSSVTVTPAHPSICLYLCVSETKR